MIARRSPPVAAIIDRHGYPAVPCPRRRDGTLPAVRLARRSPPVAANIVRHMYPAPTRDQGSRIKDQGSEAVGAVIGRPPFPTPL